MTSQILICGVHCGVMINIYAKLYIMLRKVIFSLDVHVAAKLEG